MVDERTGLLLAPRTQTLAVSGKPFPDGGTDPLSLTKPEGSVWKMCSRLNGFSCGGRFEWLFYHQGALILKERHLLDVLTSLPSLQLLMAPVLTFSEKYGEAWVLHKKICRNALKTFSQAESRDSNASCLLEERICAEAVDMVRLWRNKEMRLEIQGSTQLSC